MVRSHAHLFPKVCRISSADAVSRPDESIGIGDIGKAEKGKQVLRSEDEVAVHVPDTRAKGKFSNREQIYEQLHLLLWLVPWSP